MNLWACLEALRSSLQCCRRYIGVSIASNDLYVVVIGKQSDLDRVKEVLLICLALQVGHCQFLSRWLLWGPVLHFWKPLAHDLQHSKITFDLRVMEYFPHHSCACFASANVIPLARRSLIDRGAGRICFWSMGCLC